MGENSFKEASPEGTKLISARREQETIIARFANGFEAKLNIPGISEVAIEILPNQPPNLMFHQERHWEFRLPMDAPGVDGILLYLRQLPGFDEAAFQETLGCGERARIPLLRRPPAVNAFLQPTGNDEEDRRIFALDFDIGFQLASSGEHIAWLTTFEAAVARFGFSPSGPSRSQLPIGPVKLGALRVNEINASSGIFRFDIPLTSWRAKIVLLQDGWKRNEDQLNSYFRRMLGEPKKVSSSIHSGERTTSWARNGISLQFIYRESTFRYPEEGFCDFLVYNSRPYPEFLTDDYCSSVQPSQVKARLFSVPKIKLSEDYHLSVHVKATPPGLLDLFSASGNFLVWVDQDRARIGFADRSFAAIYPHAAVARVLLQNRIPERSARWSSLWVELVGQEGRDIPPEWCRSAGEGDYAAFDFILDQIGGMLNLPVQKLEDHDER